MEFEISEFVEKDRIQLRYIYNLVREETFGMLGKQNQEKDDFDVDTAGENVTVLHVNGEPAGFISLWAPENFIHHLYIKKEYQGKGFGKKLIDAVRSKTIGPLTLKCVEDNTIAVRFYKKNGWVAKSKGVSVNGIFILFELQA